MARWADVVDRAGELAPEYGLAQCEFELQKAGYVSSQPKS